MGWRRFAYVAAGVVLAGIVWWVLAARPDSSANTLESASPHDRAASTAEEVEGNREQPEPEIGAEEAVASPAGGEEAERTLIAGPRLSGTIRGNGQLLTGARITWTGLSEELDAGQFWWRPGDRDLVEGATIETRSEDGRFEFSALPVDPLGESVVWVTCPGFHAASVDRDADTASVEVDLVPADTCRVSVLDGRGEPIEGAWVVIRGRAKNISSIGRSAEGMRRDRSRRALLRVYEANAEGIAIVPFVDGRVLVHAEATSGHSATQIAKLERDFVLRIGPTFSAGGRVTLMPETELTPSDVWIECVAANGIVGTDLARVALQDDFRWAMDSIPWIECEKLVFRLRGGMASTRTLVRPAPEFNEHISVDFVDVGLGGIFRVKVLDPEGEPVQDALAYARTPTAEGQWHGRYARADETGLATIPGSGPGYVWVDVTAEGFVDATDGSYEIEPGREYGAVVLTLARAARIEGRCTFEGEPVEDFDIFYWTGSPTAHQIEPYRGRKDGHFVLEKAPTGTVFLRALSPGLASSESAFVEASADESASVELQLRSPAIAHGRVVDAATGNGVADALVTSTLRESGRIMRQTGTPARTGANGSFELHDLDPGENGMRVQAEGYGLRTFLLLGESDEVIDLGDIMLEPAGLLRVRLTSDTPTDFTQFQLTASYEGADMDLGSFSPGGVIERPSSSPGAWTLYLGYPSGADFAHNEQLLPRREWEIEFDVTPHRTLRVEVEPDAQGRVQEELWVSVYLPMSDLGSRYVWLQPNDSGEAAFTGLPDQPLFLRLLDSSGTLLDTREVHWEGLTERTVRLNPHAEGTRIRVVDASERPIAGARVRAFAPQAVARLEWYATTDKDGWATLGRLDSTELLVNVMHPSAGTKVGYELDLHTSNVVTMDVNEGLTIQLLDGSVPCPHIDVDFWAAHSSHILGGYTTDAHGMIELDRIEGEVRLIPPIRGHLGTEHECRDELLSSADRSPCPANRRRRVPG